MSNFYEKYKNITLKKRIMENKSQEAPVKTARQILNEIFDDNNNYVHGYTGTPVIDTERVIPQILNLISIREALTALQFKSVPQSAGVWVKASERLPEIDDIVFVTVYFDNKFLHKDAAYYDDLNFWRWNTNDEQIPKPVVASLVWLDESQPVSVQVEGLREDAESYFERSKQTFTGVFAGDYLDKEDFINYILSSPSGQEKDAVGFAEWISDNQFTRYNDFWKSTKVYYLGFNYLTIELYYVYLNRDKK